VAKPVKVTFQTGNESGHRPGKDKYTRHVANMPQQATLLLVGLRQSTTA